MAHSCNSRPVVLGEIFIESNGHGLYYNLLFIIGLYHLIITFYHYWTYVGTLKSGSQAK